MADRRHADRALLRPSTIHYMTDEALRDADEEFTRRAAALGKPGKVSRVHKAVRDARKGR
jgi:hypothetical protein